VLKSPHYAKPQNVGGNWAGSWTLTYKPKHSDGKKTKQNSTSARGQVSTWWRNWCSLTVERKEKDKIKIARGQFYHGGQYWTPLTIRDRTTLLKRKNN